jgi:hypothetical protein
MSSFQTPIMIHLNLTDHKNTSTFVFAKKKTLFFY